jgi:hypothetical protein
MGQYFLVVNLTKKEFIHPHKFGDGLKLLEFGCSADGTMTALTLLLRQSSEGGGGDYSGDNPKVGSWAGDKIVIVGDYDDSKLFEKADKSFKDVSEEILEAFKDDAYLKQHYDEIKKARE